MNAEMSPELFVQYPLLKSLVSDTTQIENQVKALNNSVFARYADLVSPQGFNGITWADIEVSLHVQVVLRTLAEWN